MCKHADAQEAPAAGYLHCTGAVQYQAAGTRLLVSLLNLLQVLFVDCFAGTSTHQPHCPGSRVGPLSPLILPGPLGSCSLLALLPAQGPAPTGLTHQCSCEKHKLCLHCRHPSPRDTGTLPNRLQWTPDSQLAVPTTKVAVRLCWQAQVNTGPALRVCKQSKQTASHRAMPGPFATAAGPDLLLATRTALRPGLAVAWLTGCSSSVVSEAPSC